jgi:circadian clock protein KaiC
MNGEIAKALGVLKKRLSDFEKTLREVTITGEGIRIGRKLSGLHGILSGEPEWKDSGA